MKIIALLRNPAARAYSGYQYALNNGYEKAKTTFRQHIDNEAEILKTGDVIAVNNLCNAYQSKYYELICEWEKLFGRSQILLLKSDDLFKNKTFVFEQIADFLNIDAAGFSSDDIHVNKASAAKFKILQQILVNRNHPFTRFVRKLSPQKFRSWSIKKRFTEKLSAMNRTQEQYSPISEDESKYLADLLQDDTTLLREHFGINFNSEGK